MPERRLELQEQGAKARRLFPGERDAELALLYTVEIPPQVDARKILGLLRKSKDVEVAEAVVRRRLVR